MTKDRPKGKQLHFTRPSIIDKKGVHHPIDDEIGRLLIEKGDGEVTEQDIKDVLKKYNLRDTLILFGDYSRYVFHKKRDGLGRAGYCEESTGVFITQFALAYFTNLLILSGADNINNKNLRNDPYSFLTLCNIYSNKLVNPELVRAGSTEPFTNDHMISLMVRMWYEQMSTIQFSVIYMMTRNIVLFCDLLNLVKPTKFNDLSDIFFQENNITIEEYIRIGFGFFSGTPERTLFTVSYLSSSSIPIFQSVFTENKIKKFLDIIAADYKTIRELDSKMNKSLDLLFTKNRFNPLSFYPLIKEQINSDEVYIIPNMPAYVYKLYGGIYWWFHDYFERVGAQHQEYRAYFGAVFEQYVGRILKGIYGEQNIYPEIVYSNDNNKFTDWYYIKDDKCYLFEAKAYQFALPSKQTGDAELVINNELKKVVEAIVQMYKNIKDIDKYDKLEQFRDKKIIPIIVFLEIPLVSSNLYREKISELLLKVEKNQKLPGLKTFEYHLINIDELELYSSVKDQVEIEDIFDGIKDDLRIDFTSFMAKINNDHPLTNSYLDKVYNDFWGQYLEREQ